MKLFKITGIIQPLCFYADSLYSNYTGKHQDMKLAVTGCCWEFLSKTLTPKTAVAWVLNIQLIKDPLPILI